MRTDKPRVLIVEDEPALCQAYAWTFREWQWTAIKALDGNEAVAKLAEPFQLISLDLKLPGLSGVEVFRQIRTVGITTPIVLVTTVDFGPMFQDAQAMKPDRIFIKPHIFEGMRDYALTLFEQFHNPRV